MQLLRQGQLTQGRQIALQAHQDGLRLRVTQTAVEFQRLRVAVGVNHEPGVEEATIGCAFRPHAGNGGLDDALHNTLVQRVIHHGGRRIRAHTAGVGPGIAIVSGLVVLGTGQRDHMLAVAHHDEAGFLAGDKVLDNDPLPGCAEFAGRQHLPQCASGLFTGGCNDDAFARRQTVCLDYYRQAGRLNISQRRSQLGKALAGRRGNAVAAHEELAEMLGAFQSGGLLRGAETA